MPASREQSGERHELRKQQILETAEDLLRRHGLSKTTVVDVAGALGLSHAAVYKYFPTKSALREAVAERWLHRISEPLRAIAENDEPAPERLRQWFHSLVRGKRKKVLDDPEMFAAYKTLAEESMSAVDRHVRELRAQVERILADGVAAGVFRVGDTNQTADALLNATIRFHHPAFVREDANANLQSLDCLLDLLLSGLTSGTP